MVFCASCFSVAMLFPAHHWLVTDTDLRAAAGHIAENSDASPGEAVWLPIDEASPELFAVRVWGVVAILISSTTSPRRGSSWLATRQCRVIIIHLR
jgi:hypothetical protein